jgi:hypothetical protein
MDALYIWNLEEDQENSAESELTSLLRSNLLGNLLPNFSDFAYIDKVY